MHHFIHRCRIRGLAALFVFAVAIVAAPARAAHPVWAPDEYALHYLDTYKHFGELDQSAVAARYELETLSERLDIQRLSLWLGASVGHLQLDDTHGTVVSLGPVLQWDMLSGDGGLYLEVGLAPTYVDSTRYGGDDLGGPLEFTSHLLLGWRLSSQRGPFIGVRVQHISNGSFYDVNPGADFVGVVAGWRLR